MALVSVLQRRMSPWWVCPSDRELSLRSRINTGYSTIASRTKLNNISTLKGSAISQLTTAEIEAIEVIIKRANVVDTVNEMRINSLLYQYQKLKNSCVGDGENTCILCGSDPTTPTKTYCNACQKVVCKRCECESTLLSGQQQILCKVCNEEQELWRKSGAWQTNTLPKRTVDDAAIEAWNIDYCTPCPSLDEGSVYYTESVRPDSDSIDEDGESDLSSYHNLSFSYSHTSTPDLDLAHQNRESNVDAILTKRTVSKEVLNESFRERSSNTLGSDQSPFSRAKNRSFKRLSVERSDVEKSLNVSQNSLRRGSSPGALRQSSHVTSHVTKDASDSGSDDIHVPTIVVSEPHQKSHDTSHDKENGSTLPPSATPKEENKDLPLPNEEPILFTKTKLKSKKRGDSIESCKSLESTRSLEDIPTDIKADQSDTPLPSTPATCSSPAINQESTLEVSYMFEKKSESDSSKESSPERVSKTRFSSLKNPKSILPRSGSLPLPGEKRSTLPKMKTSTLERKSKSPASIVISSPIIPDKKPEPETPEVTVSDTKKEMPSPIEWETEEDKTNAPPVPFKRASARRNAKRRHTAGAVDKPSLPGKPRRSLPQALEDTEDSVSSSLSEKVGDSSIEDDSSRDDSCKETEVKEREKESTGEKSKDSVEDNKDSFKEKSKDSVEEKDDNKDSFKEKELSFEDRSIEENDTKKDTLEDKRAKARLAAARVRQVKERSKMCTSITTGDGTSTSINSTSTDITSTSTDITSASSGITSTSTSIAGTSTDTSTGITGTSTGISSGTSAGITSTDTITGSDDTSITGRARSFNVKDTEVSRDGDDDEILKRKREKARLAARRVRGNRYIQHRINEQGGD